MTAAQRVLAASGPEELFGAAVPDGQPSRQARVAFRRLARELHPDHHDEPDAGRAFAHLTRLWDQHCHRRSGMEFTVAGRGYRVTRLLAEGDLANLYLLRSNTDDAEAVLKLARDAADGDLIEAEAAALTRLDERIDPEYAPYLPRLLGTVTHADTATGSRRAANLLPRLTGFVSLAEVAAAFPDGLDPRDAAWMWRRLLVGLGAAHRAGVVHGAVLPEHVLIHPEQHGLVIVDWCYHAREGGKVPAMVSRYSHRYPPEIRDGRAAGPGSDIHLATTTMTGLIGARLPDRMRRFARGCTPDGLSARPGDAWSLLSEFDELLHELYGPRRFRPFSMPSPTE